MLRGSSRGELGFERSSFRAERPDRSLGCAAQGQGREGFVDSNRAGSRELVYHQEYEAQVEAHAAFADELIRFAAGNSTRDAFLLARARAARGARAAGDFYGARGCARLRGAAGLLQPQGGGGRALGLA